MCDVPSIAVFCGESLKCFPDMASKFFLRLLVTIPVDPIVTGILLLLLLLLSMDTTAFISMVTAISVVALLSHPLQNT